MDRVGLVGGPVRSPLLPLDDGAARHASTSCCEARSSPRRSGRGAASAHLARLGRAVRGRRAAPRAAEARALLRRRAARVSGSPSREQPFEYSAFPGACGDAVAGVLLARSRATLAVVVATSRRGGCAVVGDRRHRRSRSRLAIGLARGVLDSPVMRRAGVNLEAMRGGAEPTVWLVAHLDSKWQPVSMIARVVGVVVIGGRTRAGVALSLARARPSAARRRLLVVAWVGAIPLMLSVVGERNHGTLDNASGVAAVLERGRARSGHGASRRADHRRRGARAGRRARVGAVAAGRRRAQLRQRRRRRPAHGDVSRVAARSPARVGARRSVRRTARETPRDSAPDPGHPHRQRRARRRRMGDADTQPWHDAYASEDPHVARHARSRCAARGSRARRACSPGPQRSLVEWHVCYSSPRSCSAW